MKILFLPLPSGKPWNGFTIHNEPLGGSEAAVAYIARALAKAGASVVVATHGPPARVEEVEYVHNSHLPYLVQQQWNAVIASRWAQVLQMDWSGYRVLWLHDMPYEVGQVDAHEIWFVSEAQKRAWRTEGWVTSNGYDPKIFVPVPLGERDRNKLVWISNPDRGLPLACRLFQRARERWPTLELHVYGRSSVYGWPSDIETPFLPRESEMTNVYIHDALPRRQLAVELGTAWGMFYPTYWPETFCISALEAQACGTPVITTPEGALPETVVGGIVSYDYLNALSQLRNVRRWEKLSNAGIAHAAEYTWDAVAQRWLSKLASHGLPANVGANGTGQQLVSVEHR